MPPRLRTIFNAIQDDLGRPASLYALLQTQPNLSIPLEAPEHNIAVEGVVKWHEWGDAAFHRWPRRRRGEVMGWRYATGSYSSFYRQLEDLANFSSCEITEAWECDIQDVTGLAGSKSDLREFASLDQMVETNARDMIAPISREKLRENLAWSEIRILNQSDPSDFFARYLWDGRVFLINSGGSHHFAAARHLAARLDTHVPLRGQLRTYAINESALASLQGEFEMFVIAGTPQAQTRFHDAMESFRATYLWHDLPRPYEDRRAILLPRTDARSMKVAAALHEAGCLDLGLYLKGLVFRQAEAARMPCMPTMPTASAIAV